MFAELEILSVCRDHLCRSNSYPLRPRRVTWTETKREGVKNEFSGAVKPSRLGLSYKANKCSDTATVNLGVLTTHETSPCLSLAMPAQPTPIECRLKLEVVPFVPECVCVRPCIIAYV